MVAGTQGITLDRAGFLATAILAQKGPVRCATTANITLDGVQVIDGVAVVADDRVLVKDQTDGLNGIYLAKSGNWERARDCDQRGHVVQGTWVFVNSGTANGRTTWFVTTEGRPYPGRETIAFAKLSGPGSGLDADTLDGHDTPYFATATDLAAHLTDTSGAHAASAISVSPTGSISSTDVQAALAELDSEKQPLDDDLTAIAALATESFGRSLLTYANEAAFKAGVNLEANTDFYAPGGTDVAVADGGSGRSSATAYAVVCGGTTDTGAHQSVASLGSSGQVLTSNGAGVMPTFQASASASGIVLLTSGSISSAQATLDIPLTSYTSYRAIKVLLSSFLPATDGDDLWLRISTDGGSTYDATGYSYAGFYFRDASSGAVVQGSAQAQIVMTSPAAGLDVSNSATEGGVDAEITLHDQTNTARYPAARYWCRYMSATGPETMNVSGTGTRENAQDTDAIRFMFSTGDIASGKWAVYGYA